MTAINIVKYTLRKATVSASKVNCWLSKLGGGGERERKKKEVYSYKLLNGIFAHTLLTWQKYFGFLMADLFTAQQAPGFPSYASFSSLHCSVWK